MRLSIMVFLLMACCTTLIGCAERKEPEPERVDPAELEAMREKLTGIGDEVRAASRRAAEASRKARMKQADAAVDAGADPSS